MLSREKINDFISEIMQDAREQVRPVARGDAFDEAIAHFAERAEHCPEQTIRHEVVVAILTAMKNNFWIGQANFYKYLAQAAGVEIVARFKMINGDVKEIPLSSDATRPLGG